MTFHVEGDAQTGQRLRRCPIVGEPDSDRFSTGYRRQLAIVDDLFTEGQAAYDAAAYHHAVWTLKAIDVVLARIKLALASFQAGRHHWHDELERLRPEYDPRYRVDSAMPVGA